MPFLDLQKKLGIDIDQWLLLQSGEQPYGQNGRCHTFEKEWIECSHGIGRTRAQRECKLEYEDFQECIHRTKMFQRLAAIETQRKKLEKEGKYKTPDYNKEENRP